MDSRQPFGSAWNGQGSAYNKQGHGLSGESSNNQLGFGSFAFEPPYQNPFHVDAEYGLRQTPDISMTGHNVEDRPALSIAKGPSEMGSSRRAKYEHLDWNANKAAIQSLYMDQNKSLSETMESMKNLHSFDAS